MKNYETSSIRNLGIIGHSGSGKTTLADAILYRTNSINRFGKVDDQTSTLDYDLEEKKRKISISLSVAQCEWNNNKINLIDIPGYFDFIGEMIQGLRATDVAIIVVSSIAGIQVGTEIAWKYVNSYKLPRAFYINKLDRENSNFKKTLKGLKEKFGMYVVPIQYPIGEELGFQGVVNVIENTARVYNPNIDDMEDIEVPEKLKDKIDMCKNMLIESVAETDEELLEKYFSEGTLNKNDIYKGLINGCATGEIAPVMCGSALTGKGIKTFLDTVIECFPSPAQLKEKEAISLKDNNTKIKVDRKDPFSAFIFKTIVDPFIGKMSLFKVVSGELNQDINVYNSNKNKVERISSLYFMVGKQQVSTNKIIAGDIGAITKLQYTNTGDTLCDPNFKIMYKDIEFPEPAMMMSGIPKSKNDEEKIAASLLKLLEEDPTISISRDAENAETIISGIGETHLEIIASKLKNKFGVQIELKLPKVHYRETIKKISDVQGKHKKQSGGHGQYGHVKIKFEPRMDGDKLQFEDKIVGGVVPKQYISAVEKGLKECIKHGVLAGYPVIRLKATLHDGSFHPVDSSEMAFKMATSIAFKKGLEEACPILLEPIMHVEVLVPDEYMGDIIADINKKRGKVIGMEPSGEFQKIISEVPQVEMFKYATDLRSLTQARGSFNMRFERYEEVPELQMEKIVQISNKEKETI